MKQQQNKPSNIGEQEIQDLFSELAQKAVNKEYRIINDKSLGFHEGYEKCLHDIHQSQIIVPYNNENQLEGKTLRWVSGDNYPEEYYRRPIRVLVGNGFYYSLGTFDPHDYEWWEVPNNARIPSDRIEYLQDLNQANHNSHIHVEDKVQKVLQSPEIILQKHLKLLYSDFNVSMLGQHEERIRIFILGLEKDFCTSAAQPIDAEQFAKWMDRQRDGRLPLWRDTKIWGKEGVCQTMLSIFRLPPTETPAPGEEADFYCQRYFEENGLCSIQCDHCKAYYAPLEKDREPAPVQGRVPDEIIRRIDKDCLENKPVEGQVIWGVGHEAGAIFMYRWMSKLMQSLGGESKRYLEQISALQSQIAEYRQFLESTRGDLLRHKYLKILEDIEMILDKYKKQ